MAVLFESPIITVLSLEPGGTLFNTEKETNNYTIFLLHQVVELDPGEELTAEMLPFPEDRWKFVVKTPFASSSPKHAPVLTGLINNTK